MIKLFKTRKAMKAEIDDLTQQLAVQSAEMAKLRKANTYLNRLWQDAKKEKREAESQLAAIREQLRQEGIDHAAVIGQKNKEIENLNHELAALQDANSGLASSVSDLKTKLRAAKKTNAELRQKEKRTAEHKKPAPRNAGNTFTSETTATDFPTF